MGQLRTLVNVRNLEDNCSSIKLVDESGRSATQRSVLVNQVNYVAYEREPKSG